MEKKLYPVLELKNVTKTYKHDVVKDLTFNMFPGEIFGLVGPNGAGKSTTMKMISGLVSITSGEIHVCGADVKTNFLDAVKCIGAVIEVPQMYNYLSGRKNLALYASFYGKKAMNNVEQVIDMVGMREYANNKFGTYSLGMKQRIGIAQALLNDPKLLILDEPTNGLDPNGIIEVRNLLKRLAKKTGISIFISSHNLSELELICDNIGVIRDGKMIEYRSMQEIQGSLSSQQKVCLKMNNPESAKKLVEAKFNVHCDTFGDRIELAVDDKKLAEIISYLLSSSIKISRIEKINSSLEEWFLKVINNETDAK